jgi:hypothetical protein
MVSFMFELLMVLLYGVQWFCRPFPVERCDEMEPVQTCSWISYFINVSFSYVGVHAVYAALCKIVGVAWWLSGLFYRQHFVEISSLATCIAVEVMHHVQSHLIIGFKLISPFSFQLIRLPPFLRLDSPVKLRRRCWNSKLIDKLYR